MALNQDNNAKALTQQTTFIVAKKFSTKKKLKEHEKNRHECFVSVSSVHFGTFLPSKMAMLRSASITLGSLSFPPE